MSTNNHFEQVANIISQRRTVKPQQMNGHKIEDAFIHQLLQLADWAPTHGRTEPWKFFVFAGSKVQDFCTVNAEIQSSLDPENLNQEQFQKTSSMGDKASHVIVVAMRRGHLPKIPIVEEIAATATAIQNILIGAQSLGIASFWSTGAGILKPEMKSYLGLGPEDQVLAALYLGYSDDEPKAGVRNFPITDKVQWM